MGGVTELLSGFWVASGVVLGGLGEVLGVMLAPKMAANPHKIKKVWLQEAGGSGVVF